MLIQRNCFKKQSAQKPPHSLCSFLHILRVPCLFLLIWGIEKHQPKNGWCFIIRLKGAAPQRLRKVRTLAGVPSSCISRVSPVVTSGVWSVRSLPPQSPSYPTHNIPELFCFVKDIFILYVFALYSEIDLSQAYRISENSSSKQDRHPHLSTIKGLTKSQAGRFGDPLFCYICAYRDP